MIVSSVGCINQDFEIEEKVEMKSAPMAKNTYFQDRNPENTFTPFFNRALRAKQEEKMNLEKRRRDFKKSEDYFELLRQMEAYKKPVVDTYR